MRAVVVAQPGGPEVLEIRQVDEPVPGKGEVQIHVAATAVNRADLLQRRGLYPAPPGWPADILGLEVAGHVAALGDGVSHLAEGDPVMCIVGGGGYAEKVVVPARQAVPVPAGLSIEEAAAIPEAFMTAYDALFVQGELAAGEWLLVHAAGSGVGTAAIQLARCAGARTIGTSRSAAKLHKCTELGLDVAIEVGDGRFAAAVKEASAGGVDLVLDLVGAAYLADNLSAVRARGRIVVVGLVGGFKTEINLATLLSRRLTLRGTALRTRPLEEKLELAQRFARRVVPMFDDGRLRPVVHATYPMEEVARAHAEMEQNVNVGKFVLVW